MSLATIANSQWCVMKPRRVLRLASAFGQFPTPVTDIVAASGLHVESHDISPQFLAAVQEEAQGALKRALAKVIGLLDVRGRTMHIDSSVHYARRPFLMLHELGHGVLPWQREAYSLTADCRKSILPDVADLFEREASAFASEVLFQLESFQIEASDYPIEIATPVALARKYGASIYSSIRRYVSTNEWACAVVVLNPPVQVVGQGPAAVVRRVIASKTFQEKFGDLSLPASVTGEHPLGRIVPVSGRATRAQGIRLRDRSGQPVECMVEAFDTTHQVFILLTEAAPSLRCRPSTTYCQGALVGRPASIHLDQPPLIRSSSELTLSSTGRIDRRGVLDARSQVCRRRNW